MHFMKTLFFCLIVITTSSFASVIKTDVLIFTYDTGDMLDLKRVANRLDDAGIDYKIAALGSSSDKLKDDTHYVDLAKVCQLSESLKQPMDKDFSFSKDDLNKIGYCIQAKVCVVPMSHRMFADISIALAESYKIFAYYDNMDSMKNAAYIQPFIAAKKNIDTIILPSKKTLDLSCGIDNLSGVKAIALGKPTAIEWKEIHASFSNDDAQKIFKALDLVPSDNTIIAAGGRGDSYEAFFPMIVNGLKSLDVQVWVTYHPVTDGAFERKIIEKYGAKNFKVISKDASIGLTDPTAQLSKFAKLFICHQSSADIKAAVAGLPILYVNESSYSPTLKSIAQLASTPDEVESYAVAILKSQAKPDLANIGMPEDGAKQIACFIENALKH